MTKQHIKTLPLAAAISAVVFSAGAVAADVDFYGYARSGIGASGAGGNQETFQAAGAASKYRLGNENDTYGEIGLASNLFESDEQVFRLNSLMAFGIDQENDWEGTEPAFREFNVTAKGVLGFAPEATLWAGKRYYKRQDVHMNDFYYTHIAGPGAGIENINFGFADFSIAWVRSTQDFEYYGSAGDAASKKDASTYKIAQNIIDLRLENIQTNTNGSLMLGVHYASGSPSERFNGGYVRTGNGDDTEQVDPLSKGGAAKDGYMLTAEHTQGDFFGGFNKFVVQYAEDAMVRDALGTNGAGVSSFKYSDLDGDKLSRVINHGSVTLSDNVDMLYNVMYSRMSYKESGKKDEKWLSMGVRPMYYWNDIMSTTFELGYDQVNNGILEDGKYKDSKVSKVTIAQTWSPGRGTFVRPEIRAFATYANWNSDSKGHVGGTAYANDTSGYTFGVQMEAWW